MQDGNEYFFSAVGQFGSGWLVTFSGFQGKVKEVMLAFWSNLRPSAANLVALAACCYFYYTAG